MLRLEVLLILSPVLVAAQSLPALYDVAGVLEGDVLNVRAAPNASASVVGTLEPGAEGVEVTAFSANGHWGRVNTQEWAGWASLAYLARQPGQDEMTLPLPLRCFGTEPFWSLDVDASGMRFEGMDLPSLQTSLAARTRAAGISGRYGLAGWGADGAAGLHAIVRREECTDGMSDRVFGFSVDLLLQPDDGLLQYAGCCSLAQ